ncbi:MAG: divergent polysaccharide deacetylase family protein [Peptococcaceae bacterium]|jgi:polysaccharide deacetylase 2 family uncharacterized protein YibQ|nr:divergent polysaccharide deacetylase family protein [Peptococcaceae bacterium]
MKRRLITLRLPRRSCLRLLGILSLFLFLLLAASFRFGALAPDQTASRDTGQDVLHPPQTPPPIRGQVALVIDDFGINHPGLPQMLALDVPLTAAVMPHMAFTQQEAELLHQRGLEIILHMPVEAKTGAPEWLGPGALTTELSPGELKTRLDDALRQIPYAVGISNHMGSKGTENAAVVRAILDAAQEHHLFVFDSKTSENSILETEARKAGILTGSRDVFLDNAADITSIKKQLRLLIDKAKSQKKAVGIGHVGPQGPNTARAIQELLPEFEREGIQIVPLSELLRP